MSKTPPRELLHIIRSCNGPTLCGLTVKTAGGDAAATMGDWWASDCAECRQLAEAVGLSLAPPAPPAVGLRELLARWSPGSQMCPDEHEAWLLDTKQGCALEFRRALREDPALRAVREALDKLHHGLSVLNDHHTKDHHGGVLLELDEAVSDAFLAHRAAVKALQALMDGADGGEEHGG